MEAPVSTVCYLLEKTEANVFDREEEDPDDYPFPLTLKTKKPTGSGAMSPALNGTDGASDVPQTSANAIPQTSANAIAGIPGPQNTK